MGRKKLIDRAQAKRNKLCLSLREAAPLIGVSFSTLARLERGQGSPSLLVGRRLRRWLGEDVPAQTIEERVEALEALVFGSN